MYGVGCSNGKRNYHSKESSSSRRGTDLPIVIAIIPEGARILVYKIVQTTLVKFKGFVDNGFENERVL